MKMFGKGKGNHGGGPHGEGGRTTATNKWAIWAAWVLSTAGFAILLAGVASMQSACGSSGLSDDGTAATSAALQGGGAGTVGYLGPVSCRHLLQYTWYITALHFFTWLLVLIYWASNNIHKSRAALVGVLAVAAVLLMDTANTFLMVHYASGLTGSIGRRVSIAIAGAIIAAVADMLLILIIGWDSTAHHGHTHYNDAHTTYSEVIAPRPGTATTTTTTAAGNVPYTVPV